MRQQCSQNSRQTVPFDPEQQLTESGMVQFALSPSLCIHINDLRSTCKACLSSGQGATKTDLI